MRLPLVGLLLAPFLVSACARSSSSAAPVASSSSDSDGGGVEFTNGHFKLTIVTDAAKAAMEAKPHYTTILVELVSPTDESLKSLTKLPWITSLAIDANTVVSDLTPLASLKDLVSIDIWGGVYTTLAPLSSASRLNFLRIHNAAKLSDLSPIGSLAALLELTVVLTNFGATPKTDLAPLAGLKKLRSVTLEAMAPASFAPLTALGGLHELIFSAVHADSLAPIGSIATLRTLHMNQTPGDLASLSGLASLEELEVTNAPDLTNVAFVEKLIALKTLRLSGDSHLRDLSGVKALPKLEVLNLQGDEAVADLTPAAKVKTLKEIVVSKALADAKVASFTQLAPSVRLDRR